MRPSPFRSTRHSAFLPALLLSALGSTFGLGAAPAQGSDPGPQDPMANCPMHASPIGQAGSGPQLDARGDQVMGFDHERTRHHFRLAKDGGSIEVEVTDPADGASREAIRKHLAQIAELFGGGDFAMPGAIHERALPGVETMQRLKGEIAYRYEETERGGRVRIISANPKARESIHAFLRAQIEDHRTGDPLEIEGRR